MRYMVRTDDGNSTEHDDLIILYRTRFENQRQQKRRWKRPCRTIVGVGYSSTNKKEKPRPPIPPVKVHGQGIRRQQEEVGQGQRQEGSARAAATSSAASAKASGGGKRLMLPVNKTPTPPHTHESKEGQHLFLSNKQRAPTAFCAYISPLGPTNSPAHTCTDQQHPDPTLRVAA